MFNRKAIPHPIFTLLLRTERRDTIDKMNQHQHEMRNAGCTGVAISHTPVPRERDNFTHMR